MAKIEKIKKGTATIYPATIPQAVVDPATEKTVREELDERANHGYESNPKSLKEVDDEKADHGYAVEETPKTLKEVDTLATQNTEDISQLAGEVSLLDAVHSDKIKDIENVISTMNPSQSAQLSVSGRKIVSLPKNASNGGMSMKLEGLTAENLVVNGDFRNGATGWVGITEGISVVNGELYNNGNNANLRQVYQTVLKSNQKYYIKYYYRIIAGSVGLSAGSMPVIANDVTAGSGYLSKIYQTITTNGNIIINISPSSQVYIDNVQLINLTATFGAGNEPDLATCDAMFSNYFEGVKSFVPTGRVRSVGKNLFDKSKSVRNMTINGLWTISSYVGESVTGYIPISDTSSYVISKNNTVYARRYILYDKNKNRIGTENLFGSTITPSVGTRFIRFSYITSDENLLILSKSQQPYEPYKETNLYLTAPELRSNGLVKDEIRKGANGYELVKRVGVGSLGANGISGGDFEGGLIGTKASTDDVSTWTLNNISPISGTQDGRLQVTTAGTNGQRPMLSFALTRSIGQYRRLSFNFKVNSGTPILYSISIGGSLVHPVKTFSGIGKFEFYYIASGTTGAQLLFSGINLFDIQLDNIKDELINVTDGVSNGGSATELSDGTILYTLDTPVIYPISYGGVLNSAENGTVYHEPVIADAGVYGTNMPILLTDYPISALEEIIIHKDGIDTYLDVSTAVIAADKLSFTHPSLASGDLVLFTYAYSKESTNGNITATFYDSNVVKIDTVTGKAYKINEVVTNGVLTRTLTEV